MYLELIWTVKNYIRLLHDYKKDRCFDSSFLVYELIDFEIYSDGTNGS